MIIQTEIDYCIGIVCGSVWLQNVTLHIVLIIRYQCLTNQLALLH